MIVVLTATICPCPNQVYLALSNPKTRLEQYRKAVAFYLNCKEVSGVILCDNSMSVDSDFTYETELARKMGKPLEVMYIHTDECKISQYGKGYGEAEILDNVVSCSRMLKKNDIFLKVTGRLILTNADTLIKHFADSDVDIVINQCGKASVDSRFFFAKASVYEKFFSEAKASVNDREGKYLENVYYDVITTHHFKTDNFHRFPRVRGQSGSLGYQYNDNTWKRKVKLMWRDVLSAFKYYKVKTT